jgi:hypothetical protein
LRGAFTTSLTPLSLRREAPSAAAAGFSPVCRRELLAVDFIQGKYFSYDAYSAAPSNAATASVVVSRRLRQAKEASLPARAASAALYGLALSVIVALFFVGFADVRPVMRDLRWATALSHPPRARGRILSASARDRRRC